MVYKMTPEELIDLQKAVKRAKRIATDKAGELHDLAEDPLQAVYEEIPVLSQANHEACLAWAEASARLKDAQAATA